MTYCHNCGINYAEEKKFCPYCGKKIKNNTLNSNLETTPQKYKEKNIQMDSNKILSNIKQYDKEKISAEKLIGFLQILFFGVMLSLMILALTVFSDYNEFSLGHIIPLGFVIIGIFMGILTLIPILGGWLLETTSYTVLLGTATALVMVGFLLSLSLKPSLPITPTEVQP